MENKLKILAAIILLLGLYSCEDYVSNIAPYNNLLLSDYLNAPANVPLFVTGVENQVAYTVDDLFVAADLLSDQLLFDTRNSLATYPGFQAIDEGNPVDDRTENTQGFNNAHQLRITADTLIYRINNQVPNLDPTVKANALHTCYLYSAYAYYLLASYFGKSQTEGGSPVNLSNFIPSATLYQTAINRWQQSLTYTTDAYKKKLVNSFLAKVYLLLGNYTQAATFASQGLVSADLPLLAKYNAENGNQYRNQAGESRTSLSVDNRFSAYVTANSTEKTVRIKLQQLSGIGGFIFWRQLKYVLTGTTITPIELMTWQEMNLIRAELAIRGASADNALTLINAVRASRQVSLLPAGTTITLSDPTTATSYSIYEERDKELFLTGNRLLDQRRLNKFNHLPAGSWQYLPIPRDEKDRNPNWNK